MTSWRGRVELERASPSDLPDLLAMDRELSGLNGWRGEVRSGYSDEQLVALLWSAAVRDQQVLRLVRTSAVAGYATLYDVDLVNGTGWIALASRPQYLRTGIAMVGGALFVQHCFRSWPLRKLLIEANDVTLPQFASVTRRGVATEVGRFEDRHLGPGGRRVDVVWLEIDRNGWDEFARRRVVPHLADDRLGSRWR